MTEILFDQQDGIARISLNRPAVKNAITRDMCLALADRIRALKSDTTARVVILTSEGGDLSVGADLNEMSDMLPEDPRQRGDAMANQVREISWPIFLALSQLPQPIITSARGYAIGAGAQLILSADLCVCSSTLKMIMPQVNLAHPVDHGESYYLPRKLGMAKAMQLSLLGETVTAQEAERIGLANWCVEDNQLEAKTAEIAHKLASMAPRAVQEIKGLLAHSLDRDIESQFAEEAHALSRCAATNDFVEAITAFTQKRKPRFTGS
jgi:2-(1,2-epoxy-1,2-dihydrophenyl)acetyl-CoA isomerase